ncbi:MAG: NAD+ synthase [Candidatus Omnitrophota bacterium]
MKNKIIKWIKAQVKNAGATGIVLGLSGGIDSSVVAALGKEAVGRNKLLALILPCHSQVQDLEDARFIARRLGIRTKTIDLSFIYDKIAGVMPKAKEKTRANIKSRLRMLVIYYFANEFNYLACGTSNKSEGLAGYFTKYGDGASDILPLGDLFKKEVVRLAEELEIPSRIIVKPPTAGLWPGQTDEGEMGITYRQLDEILERKEKGLKQTAGKQKVARVFFMVSKSEHKRQGPKICYI